MNATARTATLHGHALSYLDSGEGPAVLFIHGLLGSHRNWAHLVDALDTGHRVLAPDLIGHGASAKPRGDYSLGAHAATLRDLLDRLGIDRVTLVGHSLGGGIAMQFCYLFPDRVERLVLVSSGGLGRSVSPLLRSATLPGAEWVLPLIASGWVRGRAEAVGGPCAGWAGARAPTWRRPGRVHVPGRGRHPTCLSRHDPLRHRPGRPDRHRARPPAHGHRHPHPRRLGHAGPDDSRLARDHGPAGDRRQPGGALRGRRPLPHLDQPERSPAAGRFMAG